METRKIKEWVVDHHRHLLAFGSVIAAWYAAKSLPRKLFDVLVWTMTIKLLWKGWRWADYVLDQIPGWAAYWLDLSKKAVEAGSGEEVFVGIGIVVISVCIIIFVSRCVNQDCGGSR